MTKQEIEKTLKEDLGVQKDIIALKPLKEIPSDVPHYEGVATPGLCVQIGEVLRDGSMFYTTKENHQCFEGLIATGVCELSREEFRAAVAEFLGSFPAYKDIDTAMSLYEKCISAMPVPAVTNRCLLVGPLSRVEDPDLVLIFCTPKQADILVRIRAYLGGLCEGFGGSGGCLFNIRHAFYKRIPTFSTSDLSWRMFIGLDDNELTVTMPYEKLQEIAPYIKTNVDYVNNFSSMF
jgi:uncharacterized protein (DUF169 family)